MPLYRTCSTDSATAGGRPRLSPSVEGQPVAAVWRDDDGNVFLPFDPGEVMHYFWSEKYRGVGRSAMSARSERSHCAATTWPGPAAAARTSVAAAAGLHPGAGLSRSFPGWPIEDNLHNFYSWLFSLVTESGWPAGALPGSMAWRPVVGPRPDARRGDR